MNATALPIPPSTEHRAWVGFLALLITAMIGAAPVFAQDTSGDPFAQYRALPPDSVEARQAIIDSDPIWFQDVFDSLLCVVDLEDPEVQALFEEAAGDHFAVTGDSLLLSDFMLISGVAPAVRAEWYQAVLSDDQGWIVRAEGDFEGSVPHFTRAAEEYRRLGDLRREAIAWGSLGVSYYRLADFDAAEQAYLTALDARRRLGDRWMEARSLRALGSTYMQTGRYRKSLGYYEQARDVIATLEKPIQLGTTWAYIGNVYYRLGMLDEAVTAYETAIEMYGDAGETFSHPARTGLANVYGDLGELKRALPLYLEQLALVEDSEGVASGLEVGDAWVNALANVADTYIRIGDPSSALRELGTLREILEETNDRYRLAQIMNLVGGAYEDLGNTTRALEAFREAESLAEETDNPLQLAHAWENSANVYQEMGLGNRAIEFFEKAKEMFIELEAPQKVSILLSNLAIVYEQKEDFEQALALYQEALVLAREKGNRSEAARNRSNITNVLSSMDRLEEALVESRGAVQEAEALGHSWILWPAYLGLADCFERGGDLDSARVYNNLAIEVMETARGRALSEETKTAFLGKRAFIYEAQVHVLGKLYAEEGREEFAQEAFATAERGKARALLDAMAEGRVDLDSGVDPALVEERTGLERSIATIQYRMRLADQDEAPADTVRVYKKQLRELENDLARVLERIRLNNPRFATMDAGAPSDPATIQKTLLHGKKDRILLEYSLGDSASYLWVLTGKDLELHVLPPRSDLEPLVRDLRAGLTNPAASGDAGFVAAAATLHEMLLEPAAREIDKAKIVFLVPDGVLSMIPFEGLLREAQVVPGPDADAETRNRFFADLPYALENREVRYGPSATTLAMLMDGKKKDAKDLSLLAIGDPVFGEDEEEPKEQSDGDGLRGGLDPLPFTREEVETISRFFDPSRVTVLLGEDARESRLTEPGFLADYDIIHFATHGLIDERRPERSKLALSFPKDPTEDGYLQASEIYRLDLGADLVVLSACETGLGRMVRGEGVLGLPRAFFYAGVSSVVVSLWSVSDRSTSQLMAAFYKRMTSGGESPARALAGAKDDLRKEGEFAHPFYWSPFVLMGTF